MLKKAVAILSGLILVGGVAWSQSVPSASRPILSGPLAKLDIKDAQVEAGRGAPKGALRIGLHFGIDPGWFDPLGYYGAALQFFYLMHDALIKPMPQGEFTYSLAERAEMSADYRRAAFRLRPGLKFQDGDPLTTAASSGPTRITAVSASSTSRRRSRTSRSWTTARSSSTSRDPSSTSWISTAGPGAGSGGSCRDITTNRLARTASRPVPWAPGRSNS